MSRCTLAPTRLRTNGLDSPLGILSSTPPRFSWAVNSSLESARNETTSGFRIVARSVFHGGKVLWDSGRIQSSNTLQIKYRGNTLSSTLRVSWRVTIWDGFGRECSESQDAFFETALQAEADWRGAEWIARYHDLPSVTDCNLYARSARNEAPRFRVDVDVPASAIAVRAYVAGLGYHRVHANGQRASDSELDAGWSVVEKTVFYSTLDLTARLPPGKPSTFGVELGNAFWNPLPLRFWGHLDIRAKLLGRNGTREPIMRALVLAIHANGSASAVAASTSVPRAGSGGWLAGGSPTLSNNIYLGEHWDGGRARSSRNWCTRGFVADASWAPPVAVPAASRAKLGQLTPNPIPPIKRIGALGATLLANTSAEGGAEGGGGGGGGSVLVLDIGRNIAGACRWNVSGPIGSVVEMRYGELLFPNGSVNVLTGVAGAIKQTNPGAPCQPALAYQGDRMTLSGHPDGDVWTPAWSWHGFRYIEVLLPPGGALQSDAATAVASEGQALAVCYPMRTDVAQVATFASSDPKLDALRALARHTFDANMMGVQSDCPARERFGYGGDALGCGEAGLSIFDWESFYAKRVGDFNDAMVGLDGSSSRGFTETAPFVGIASRGVGPEDAGPVGWQAFQPEALLWLYKYFGDVETMGRSYNHTYSFVRMLEASLPNNVTSDDERSGLGDWCPVDHTRTAYTALGFKRMAFLAFANVSSLVGSPLLATEYTHKAASVAAAINKRFLSAESGVYRTAVANRTREDTQTGQGMAIFTGLCGSHNVCEKALEVLKSNALAASYLPHACQATAAPPAGCGSAKGGPGPHLTAGLFGIKWTLLSLADHGYTDLAHAMVTSDSFPSHGWMMNNPYANATTIWENWVFSDSRYSHDHPMFASTEVWILQSIAGIQPHPAARGMDQVLIKPAPPTTMSFARATFETPRGTIGVSWARLPSSRGAFALNVSIPPNCRATVHVPAGHAHHSDEQLYLYDAGRHERILGGVRRIPSRPGRADGSLVVDLGSGHYQFESRVVGGEFITGSSPPDNPAEQQRHLMLWLAASTQPVFEDTLPPPPMIHDVHAGAHHHAEMHLVSTPQLAMMAGETEAVQLVLRASTSIDGLRVSSARCHAPAGTLAIDVRQVGYVWVNKVPYWQPKGAGWYPDPLLPLPKSGGLRIAANTTQPLYVSIRAAGNATAGNYSCVLILDDDDHAQAGAGSVTSLPSPLANLTVRVQVWPIHLPPLLRSRFTPYVNFYDLPAWITPELRPSYQKFMCEHRMPPDSTYETDVSMSAARTATFEFLAACGSQRMNIADLSAILGGRKVNYTAAEVEARLDAIAPRVEWLANRSLLGRSYVYGFDEAPRTYEGAIRALFGGVKARWPGLRTVSVLNWPGGTGAAPGGGSGEVPTDLPVDDWVVEFRSYNASNADAWRAAGKPIAGEYWCCCYNYHSCLNAFVEWPALLPRLMPWLAAVRRTRGLLYFTVNHWFNNVPAGHYHNKTIARIDGTSHTDFDPDVYGHANGDGGLIYPGPDGPVSSLRFEALRDGLEDWELMDLLEQRIGKPPMDLLTAVIRSPSERASDEAPLETARRQAAARLAAM